MVMVVDAHHHFWDPDDGDFPWMAGDDMSPIRRIFAPDDLRPLLKANAVDKTVLVQTQASLIETRQFMQIAADTDFVAGVVGWADLTDPELPRTLEQLRTEPGGDSLVGIRHQVHDEDDANWLCRDDVMRGLGAITDAGLVYDLLTRTRELPAALETVRQFPDTTFVIDHISKPQIAEREIDQWRALIEPFGQYTNVWCKVSGMVTEANWQNWSSSDLTPYIDTVLRVFGPGRLLYGSDWPVCVLAAEYAEVKQALEHNLASLSASDYAAVMGGNAISVYGLSV